MTRNDGLPRRVYVKHGRYYYVRPDTKWVALTLVKDGDHRLSRPQDIERLRAAILEMTKP